MTEGKDQSASSKKLEKVSQFTAGIIAEQAHTLATHDIDPEEYKHVFKEAILRNPDIIDAMATKTGELTAARAFRQCCKDGLVPDGRDAAMWAFKNEVFYLPMVDGLKRIIYEKLGADVDAGVIRACDEYKLKQVPGQDPVLEIVPCLDDENKDQTVIAAWCYIRVPGETGKLTWINRKKIDAAKSRSKTRASDSAWNVYADDMAVKVAVKSAARKLFHKIPNKNASNLVSAVEYDDKTSGMLIDNAAKLEEPAQIENDTPTEPVDDEIEPVETEKKKGDKDGEEENPFLEV